MSASILRETARRLLAHGAQVGRNLGLHFREGGGVFGFAKWARRAFGSETALSKLGECGAQSSVVTGGSEEMVDKFGEQIVVGFHRWLAAVVSESLAAEDRAKAEAEFPTILAVFEAVMNGRSGQEKTEVTA